MKKTLFLLFLLVILNSWTQPFGLLFHQPYANNQTAYTSTFSVQDSLDIEVADNFQAVNNAIEELVFYGLTLTNDGDWTEHTPNSFEPFLIRFYELQESVTSGLITAYTGMHTIELYDSYGDGWNGGSVSVFVQGNEVLSNIAFTSGFGPESFEFFATAGNEIYTVYFAGGWSYENYYRILDPMQNIIAEDGGTFENPGDSTPIGIQPGGPYILEPSWEQPYSTQYLNANVISTGDYFADVYQIYKFTVPLNSSVTLEEGWFSVQIDSNNGSGTWFLWLSSNVGDSFSHRRIGTFQSKNVRRNDFLKYAMNSAQNSPREVSDYDFAIQLWGGELPLPEPATNPNPVHGSQNNNIQISLSWIGHPEHSGYKIYFGSNGGGFFDPTNLEYGADLGNTTIYEPGYLLEYSKIYYWKIVPYNAQGEAENCPIWSFTTKDDPLIIPPWSEDFFGESAGTIPLNWQRTHTNWSVNNSLNAGGLSPEVRFNWTPTVNGVSRIITPPIQFESRTDYKLTFKHMLDHFSGNYAIKVQSSLDGETWLDEWIIVNPLANIPAGIVNIPLPHLAGETFYLAWVFEGNSYNIDYWYIDDIELKEIPIAPLLSVTPDSHDFFEMSVYSQSSPQTFTIRNIGIGYLEVENIYLSGNDSDDFTLQHNFQFPVILAENEFITVNATFFPNSEGEKNAFLTVQSNIEIKQIPLSGTAIDISEWNYLIINLGSQPYSANTIHQVLQTAKSSGGIVNYIPSFESFSLVPVVYVLLGIYNYNYVLNEADSVPLTSYLNNGGNLYMEGGDTWAYDTLTSLHSFFGITGLTDGSADLSQIDGIEGTWTGGIQSVYTGRNNYIDRIIANPNIPYAYPVFRNDAANYVCGVALQAPVQSKSTYRTVGTSFELGGTNDIMILATHYFLLNGENAPEYYKPRNLIATVENDIVNMQWDLPIAGEPQAYNIYRNQILTDSVVEPFFIDSSVINGSEYIYYVTAIYDSTESIPSNIAEVYSTAIVTFFPNPDIIYTEPIIISLETETEGAIIEYRIVMNQVMHGKMSSKRDLMRFKEREWVVYTEPFELDYDSVSTIEARASKANWITSEIAFATYTITGTVATPTFSPNPNVIYTEPIAVTLQTTTAGATIEYRFVNEIKSSYEWIIYEEPFELDYNSVTTIEARASKANWITSEIASATYTITGTVATPTFSPNHDVIYTESIAVTLQTITAGATIEYRFAENRNWVVYTEPIELGYNSVTTIEARASKENWITSDIVSATYTITGTVAVPTFSPNPNVIYTEPIAVTLQTTTADATIEYRFVNELKSSYEWIIYEEPFELDYNSVTTIEARAVKENWGTSEIVSATYTITGTVAVPTFSPNPNVIYTEPIAVTLQTTTADATIEYRFVNELKSSYEWIIYEEPFELDYNSVTTIEARAVKENWGTSEIVSATYTITGTVAAPTFSPNPNVIYTEPIAVTLQTITEGASIEYRFSDTRNWVVYTEPIELDYNSVTTIEARASKANWITSDIVSATYTITGIVATPTFSPNPNVIYTEPISVTLQTITEGASIEYRFSDTRNWVVYTEPIELDYNSVTTIEARASKENWITSDIVSATYTITGTVATPTFSPNPDVIYTEPISVTLQTTTAGATIEYRFAENRNWVVYAEPFELDYNSVTTIEARASKENWITSDIVSATYTITGTVATPTFSPNPNVIYNEPISVTLQTITEGATIEYRFVNELKSSYEWIIYEEPFELDYNSVTTIEARASKANWITSEIAFATYTITGTVATPTFLPYPDGFYDYTIEVSIQTETEDALVFYRYAGDLDWLVYTEPIFLDYNTVTTIEAMATKESWINSDIATATYSIIGKVITPTFSPNSETIYTEPIEITIQTETDDAVIEFSTSDDEGESWSDWQVYTNPINLGYDSTIAIQARASKENWLDSEIAFASYLVTSTVATPTFNPIAGIYYEAIYVAISSASVGATVHYRSSVIGGSWSDWEVFFSPIHIPIETEMEFEAYATKELCDDSQLAYAFYSVTNTAVAPTFSPNPNVIYTEPIAVTLETTTQEATIEYRFSGDEDWIVYTEPIQLEYNSFTTVEARAVKENWGTSDIVSATYTITGTVAAPTFSHESGVYTEPISVTLQTTTVGATIEYRFAENRNWVVYTEPIELGYNSVTTIEARASKENWITSDIVSATYTITGTVAAPTFSPNPDVIYNEPISVTIESATAGASIEYRFAENRNWVVYTAPIELGYNSVTTIEARASKENWITSDIVSATYTITGTVAAPTFSHESGVYTEPISVTLQTTTEGASIEYRFADMRNWVVYTEPIELDYNSVITIEARASKENWITSDIVSATYTITGTVAAPTFSHEGGVYSEPIAVTLETATEGATIEYRFADMRNWVVYTEPIEFGYDSVTTIEARASKEDWITSEIASTTYTITGTVATPTFSHESDIYNEPIAVTLQTITEGATIEYRFAENRNWVVYTEPIELGYNSVTTIEARASKANWISSDIVSATYTITGTVATPTFSHESGVYTEPISVTLQTTTVGATIEYRFADMRNWVVYTEPIELGYNSVTTIEARASKENWITSDIVSATYAITGTVAAPTFSHESGVYTEPISVALQTTTEDATIEYRFADMRNWVVYTAPIELELNSVTTIEARASKENWGTSDIVSATYTITGTVAAPTFSHESDIYNEPIAVTLQTITEGATIEYRFAENRNWVVYTEPIELGYNSVTTIEARASKENWITSDIVSATYTITGTVATPTFLPYPNVIYTEPISVTLQTTTEDATIEYRFADMRNWVVYTEPIELGYNSVTTIEARASKENWITSEIASATYTITGTVAAPTFSHESGVYTELIAVTIETATEDATIEYRFADIRNWVIYTEPIELELNSVTTIEARASKENWVTSEIVSATYTITGTVADPTFSLEGGVYSEPIAVTLQTTTAGASIEYRFLDTRNWVVYTEPIELGYNSVTTIEARASKENWITSDIVSATYTITGTVAAPTFSPNPNVIYTEPIAVTLQTTTAGATIEYRFSDTRNWVVYTEPIELGYNSVTTIETRASKENWITSDIVSATYTITGTVAAPTFSPEGGVYSEPISVTLQTTTVGATIEYRFADMRNWVVYTEPIELGYNSVTTIEARASKENWITSEIASATYTITGTVATPTFSPESGIYNEQVIVEVFTETEGATIYYTLTGENPDENSLIYSVPLTITETTTIKARAYKSNWIASDIATALYEITGSVAMPIANPPAGTYLEPQMVTLSCVMPEAVIRYTTDGTEPSENSSMYEQPLVIEYSTVLKAKAYRENWIPSETLTSEYHILYPPLNLMAEAGYLYVNLTWEMPEIPVITNLSAKKNFSISRDREEFLGYNVYRNGNLINEELVLTELYEDLSVAGGVNYQYYVTAVYEEGESNSSNTVYVTTPNMVAAPVFSPESGYYEEAIEIVISCSTPNATIYYTLDGSEPNHLSEEYFAPLTLEGIVHIKARAYKVGWLPSDITEADYEIVVTESGESTLLPTVTALEAAYPNPFNPETTIRFSLHEDSYVTISIYNSKGQKVRNIVSEQRQKGFHNVVWNGKNDEGRAMPSGVYLYALQTSAHRYVRKAILLK
jgi:hypothetical protein